MTYFTSWDANVFLCLLTYLPEDVVKGMMDCVKKTHEEFSLEEAKEYWVTNSPKLEARVVNQGRKSNEHTWTILCFEIEERKSRIETWQNRRENIIEFKREWRLRSIEQRQEKVVGWCKFGDNFERLRHQGRLSNCWIIDGFGNKWEKNPELKEERRNYTNNLWATWEAMASSYYFVGWDRRVNASKWYEGIHPGRFFLFFQKNKIIEERFRGVPKGPCEDGYRYPPTPIFDKGPYEQLIEDLRCLDGGGLGENTGKTVEHIDDLFS